MKLFTIPNFLTLGNLLCGSLVLLFLNIMISNEYDYTWTILILLIASLILDFLDGMSARLLKSNSEIGLQLDSLADMVSFGLAPGFMMFLMLGGYTIHESGPEELICYGFVKFKPIAFAGFLITLFSALRLAKFNVDTGQSTYFKGLATPANTILIFSLLMIQTINGNIISNDYDVYLLSGVTLLSSWLLISNVPLFSFKFKGLSWKDNHYKYIFIIISLILFILFQFYIVPFIILIYIILSILFRKKIINA